MEPTDLDTVFVAGASGKTGQQVLQLLTGRVATVRALTRSSSKAKRLEAAGADEVVVDDLLDPQDLVGAIGDADVVISAVGTGVTDVWTADRHVDGAGNCALLEAALDAGADAFVMVSALGVGDEPSSALGTLFNACIRPVQKAKGRAEAAVRAAPIRHTIFRPGALTSGPRRDDVSVAAPGAKLWGAVSRADVARLMVAAPVTHAAANRTLEVVSTPSFPDRSEQITWVFPGPRE